ncbi:PqqD family protein [Mesorhizobium sp. KR9-304]|uniref:PqqD family protein n=1 Tax=Mesorhizobium sp. KR9-304 TaxID=3156614 RepID=UPI0032B4B935
MPHDEVYSLSPLASFQSVGDGAVVLLADSGQLYSCNDTSEAFLRHVDGKRSLADIVDLLAEEYEVEREMLEADLAELAASLIQEGVIVGGKN